MRVFITNDDGVYAPGIASLTAAFSEAGYLPLVVAPDRERSSVGHAITLTRPLKLAPLEIGSYPEGIDVYCCDGTPSDCVVLGTDQLLPQADFVISGINNGPNLGDDLTYSGTVSAAMEGSILGYPSIAVSLNCLRDDKERHYSGAAQIVVSLVRWLAENPAPQGIVLNVNVPNLPPSLIKGVKITHKGVRVYADKVTKLQDPSGRNYYWVAGRPEDDLVEGSDVWAVAHGYVSVTPIHMDMTHYDTLEVMRSGGIEGLMGQERKK